MTIDIIGRKAFVNRPKFEKTKSGDTGIRRDSPPDSRPREKFPVNGTGLE